jgi:hypothetical protein
MSLFWVPNFPPTTFSICSNTGSKTNTELFMNSTNISVPALLRKGKNSALGFWKEIEDYPCRVWAQVNFCGLDSSYTLPRRSQAPSMEGEGCREGRSDWVMAIDRLLAPARSTAGGDLGNPVKRTRAHLGFPGASNSGQKDLLHLICCCCGQKHPSLLSKGCPRSCNPSCKGLYVPRALV